MKNNRIVDIRKQKTIKNCQKGNPPSTLYMQKLKFLKNSGKDLEQSKMKKKRIVDIRKQKKMITVKNVNTPPPSTIYMQKIEKFKNFQITQKWCETFKNLVESVAIINNEGKRSQ